MSGTLKYTTARVVAGSELAQGLIYERLYCEICDENVIRKVEVLPDGTMWRQSVDQHWNPVPGSLFHGPLYPGMPQEAPVKESLAIEWCSAEEFECVWNRATRSPWGRVEDLIVLSEDDA